MMSLFGEHKPASARERIKTGFRESAELEFAITVGEKRKHIKSQPVGRRFIESAKDARLSASPERLARSDSAFLAAIATEVAMQQINHGPEMAPFFDIDLKKCFADRTSKDRRIPASVVALRMRVRYRPGVTITRRKVERYSPGNFLQAGCPL